MNRISASILSFVFTLSYGFLHAQATVLQDYYSAIMNAGNPKEFTEYNGYLYFSAATDDTGRELWRTEGTSAGTKLFMDIGEYVKEGNPRYLTLFNSLIFFVANDGFNGDQIWKTDGTPDGTVMVTNLEHLDPTDLIVCNGEIYFSGGSLTNGRELWKTDGTASGTSMVKDIYPGFLSSITTGSGPFFTVFNNKLYFYCNDSMHGYELWESDGTTIGTNMVLDIWPGTVSSIEEEKMLVFNGALYFAANDGVHGSELWKSDGTAAGTQLLLDVHTTASGNPSQLTISGGLLYFSANDGLVGDELWKTDGTASGTLLVKDLAPGASGSLSDYDFFDFNGTLIFNASASGTGYELYKSDGTVAGTGIIKDIRPGLNSGDPKGFVQFNSQVYFRAASNLDIQLWRTDGTNAGTVQVESITNGINDGSKVFNNELFFVANNTGANNFELWKTDGTNSGTSMVRDIYSNTSSSEITDWTILNDKYLFGPLNTTYGKELFQSDGTVAGTGLLKDINVGATSHGIPQNFVNMGSNAYFFAHNTSSSTYPKLHRTDGTNAGTIAISGSYDITKLNVALGNNVCFFVHSLPNDRLYKTDGVSSPILVAQLTGSSSLYYQETNHVIVNNVLYFVANYTGGYTLWRTDGTSAGTFPVRNFNTTNAPDYLIDLNGMLYFSAENGTNGVELWKSDGTTAGTVMLTDIYTGSGSSSPTDLTVSGGKIYFSAMHPAYGRELWVSDGTAAGTMLVNDLEMGSASSSPVHITSGPNCIWYSAFTQANGRELWKKWDNAAPVLVVDIFPGSPSSNPSNLKVIDGELYFGATNGVTGAEPYKTLGSTCSTLLIGDLNPGDVGSYPEFFGKANNKILLYGTAFASGRELISIDGPSNPQVDSVESCLPYVWTATGDTLMNSGFYSGIVQNQGGCDSLIHLQLMIHYPDSVVDNETACTSYTWIDGNTYYASTNTPTVILQNAFGCDSIITLHLTILSDSVTDTQTVCDSLVWIDGVTYYSSISTPTLTLQNTAGCDSIITLNLTILNSSSATQTQTACGSYDWPINGQTYTASGQYTDTIPNAAACDSIITLNLTIIPDLPLTIDNTFSIPSDANSCVGEVAVTVSGNAPFELDFDNGSQVITSNGYSLVTGLCAGVHDLHVTDNCGDALSTTVVIPVDSNYVFNNPFIDSLAQDSLGVTMTNCDIYYAGIDTAYIDSIWATGNTVNVIWNIVDSNGSNLDTTSYVLNNGNGVYWLQLNVFCPFKAVGEYFTVTEAIYFNNGTVSTAGLADIYKELFAIYPNPTNDKVHITFSGSDAELTVYDVQGKMVLKDRIQNQEVISLQNFERGVYLFDFSNSNGRSIQRVVKH